MASTKPHRSSAAVAAASATLMAMASSSLPPAGAHQGNFCGTSLVDAVSSCARPCPSGAPSGCNAGETCFANTLCAQEKPGPTPHPTPFPQISGGVRTCGNGDRGNGQCPIPSECCSQQGHCGTSAEHCSSAGVESPPSTGGAAPSVLSVFGTCGGGQVGNGICGDNSDCCSQDGFCGKSFAHCVSKVENLGPEGILEPVSLPQQRRQQIAVENDGGDQIIAATGASFDECVMLQAFGDLAADDAPCCADFPDAPLCAYLACLDETDGVFTCDCDVVSGLLAKIESGTSVHAAQAIEAQGLSATAAESCCLQGTSLVDFQACMGASLSSSLVSPGGAFAFTWPPTSSPAPVVCGAESEALYGCHATERDPFGFGAVSCASCELTVVLGAFSFFSCNGKETNGFCGKYAECAHEQCNAECVEEAFDLLHCSLNSTEEEDCDLRCSPDDVFNSTEISQNTTGPGTLAQSFGECVLLQSFQSIFDEPSGDASTDPTRLCCVHFPETPYCAYLDCFDEETEAFNCECSVMVDLLTESQNGTETGPDTDPLAPFLTLAGGEDPGIAAAAEECCQEGTSSAEFQACMDGMFPDEAGGGFSWPPTSSPAPDVCADEREALFGCHATEEDPFGFGATGCASCEFTLSLENLFGFFTCEGMVNNDFCGKYAECADEKCTAECIEEVYDLLHCSLNSTQDCELQCSPEDVNATSSGSVAPTNSSVTEIALATNTGPTESASEEGDDPVTTMSSATVASTVKTDATPAETTGATAAPVGDGDSGSSMSTTSTVTTPIRNATQAASTTSAASTNFPTAASSTANATETSTTSTVATRTPNATEAASPTTTASTSFPAATASTSNTTETAPTAASAPAVSTPEPEPEGFVSAAFKPKDAMAFFIGAAVVGGMNIL